MPTPRVGRKIAPPMPCSSMSLMPGIAVEVLGVLAQRVEVAEELLDALALGVAAAEVLVERAGLGDRVPRGVGDEAVDLAADEQPLPAVDLRPLHRAARHALLGVAGEGVDRLVVVVVAVEVLEVDVAGHGSPSGVGGPSSLRNLCERQPSQRGAILRDMPNHPVRDDIDLLDGHWYSTEPHDDWAWMREHAPVYYDATSDVWAITKYADVLAIEKDAKGFSSYGGPRPHGMPLPMMISMDNPEHQRRRSLVYHGFTPKRVAEHEATHPRHLQRDRRRVCERGECDFVWDIAAPLPLLLIADMLGFGPERVRRPAAVVRRPASAPTTADPSPRSRTASLQASLGFRELQLEVIADRRSKPQQSDLISLLLPRRGRRRAARRRVDRAGDAAHPHRRRRDHAPRHHRRAARAVRPSRAVADHARRPRRRHRPAVEEMLRWVSPIKNMARTVVDDVELRGETLHAGDQVILMYPSANRDADEFADPFTLRRAPRPEPHIAFGFGPHYCLGAGAGPARAAT